MTLIHPRLLAALNRFYPSTCVIEQATITLSEAGTEVKAWATLAGHGALRASVAPIQPGTPEVQEKRQEDTVPDYATHHISLAGHYPQITTAMRARVGTETFDILAVEHSSQSVTTRLRVEIQR